MEGLLWREYSRSFEVYKWPLKWIELIAKGMTTIPLNAATSEQLIVLVC